MITLKGQSLVAGTWVDGTGDPFASVSRGGSSGREFPEYRSPGPAQIDAAIESAAESAERLSSLPISARVRFMKDVAKRLAEHESELAEIAQAETALPIPRLRGEIGRTCFQLNYYADHLASGNLQESYLDEALPDRLPLPRPRLQSGLVPVGPVVVFGASNFPFAYSVAGGDTASAWAAGCPVIVKGHPAHPATSEAVGRLISQVITESEAFEGCFSLIITPSYEIGQQLVSNHKVKAVGFTGSKKGGLALQKVLDARPVPAPLFAEMGSVNPSIILPSATAIEGAALASQFATSICLGVGQFCTNPGVILLVDSVGSNAFEIALADGLGNTPAGTMLSESIEGNYLAGLASLAKIPGVTCHHPCDTPGKSCLFTLESEVALENPAVFEEVFGPSSAIIRCRSAQNALDVLQKMGGQLTVSLHGREEDLSNQPGLIYGLSQVAGRVIWNQLPTGVEVCDAMVHGGPWPSTSDGRSTSVGIRAVSRWQRPVCFQNFPDSITVSRGPV